MHLEIGTACGAQTHDRGSGVAQGGVCVGAAIAWALIAVAAEGLHRACIRATVARNDIAIVARLPPPINVTVTALDDASSGAAVIGCHVAVVTGLAEINVVVPAKGLDRALRRAVISIN